MSTLTNGAPFEFRVMIESSLGRLVRVNIWTKNGESFVSFTPDVSEEEVTEAVARAVGLIRPLDVKSLFRDGGGRRRRFIETE